MLQYGAKYSTLNPIPKPQSYSWSAQSSLLEHLQRFAGTKPAQQGQGLVVQRQTLE